MVLAEGVIESRPCHAGLKIHSPIDHSDWRAIVIPYTGAAHNHPVPIPEKLTRTAEYMYGLAAKEMGLVGATARKVDQGTLV